ncbi:hypothetical protein Tco_1273094 [Tanacetum coccineum]
MNRGSRWWLGDALVLSRWCWSRMVMEPCRSPGAGVVDGAVVLDSRWAEKPWCWKPVVKFRIESMFRKSDCMEKEKGGNLQPPTPRSALTWLNGNNSLSIGIDAARSDSMAEEKKCG